MCLKGRGNRQSRLGKNLPSWRLCDQYLLPTRIEVSMDQRYTSAESHAQVGEFSCPEDLPRRPGVLIADDNEQVRQVLSVGLRRRGFDVWLAAHGLEAIETYARLRDDIALVMLDVRMSELDGPQTLVCLHRLNAQLPVCFLTGDLGSYREQQLLDLGAAHVFHKPVRFDELADALKQMIDGVPALCAV